MSPLNVIFELWQVLSEVAVTTSPCTDDSQESAGLLPGSPRILSESQMAALPNMGRLTSDCWRSVGFSLVGIWIGSS
jgi:hypothetical protein